MSPAANNSDNNDNNIVLKPTLHLYKIDVVDDNDDETNKHVEINHAQSSTYPSTLTTVTDSDCDNRVMNPVTPDRSNHDTHQSH
jgi:hypothetical protein